MRTPMLITSHRSACQRVTALRPVPPRPYCRTCSLTVKRTDLTKDGSTFLVAHLVPDDGVNWVLAARWANAKALALKPAGGVQPAA